MTAGWSDWTLQWWRKIVKRWFKNSQTPAGTAALRRACNKSSASRQLPLCTGEHQAGARQRNLSCPSAVHGFCFPRTKPTWEVLPHHAGQHNCMILSQLESLLGQVPPTGDLRCKGWRSSIALWGKGSRWDILVSQFSCTLSWSNEL